MNSKYRFKVEKLIRDKLPDWMHSNGITICQRVMEQNEYLQQLKLDEQVFCS